MSEDELHSVVDKVRSAFKFSVYCLSNSQGKCRLSLERSQPTDLLPPAFKLVVQTIQSVDGDADGKISFVEFQKVTLFYLLLISTACLPYCISF